VEVVGRWAFHFQRASTNLLFLSKINTKVGVTYKSAPGVLRQTEISKMRTHQAADTPRSSTQVLSHPIPYRCCIGYIRPMEQVLRVRVRVRVRVRDPIPTTPHVSIFDLQLNPNNLSFCTLQLHCLHLTIYMHACTQLYIHNPISNKQTI
jgi:hypothetical protein